MIQHQALCTACGSTYAYLVLAGAGAPASTATLSKGREQRAELLQRVHRIRLLFVDIFCGTEKGGIVDGSRRLDPRWHAGYRLRTHRLEVCGSGKETIWVH